MIEVAPLWEILVPTVRRVGGRPYRTRFHRTWDAKVRAMAGGLTVLQPGKGQWLSKQGELHVERMIPVRVACTREVMMKIAEMTLVHYDQLAVMYWKVSDDCRIVHRSTGHA